MNVQTVGWIGLVLLLCFSTFGAFWCLTFIFGVVSFIIGLLTLLYLQTNNIEDIYFHNSLLENPLNVPKSSVGGLKRVIQFLAAPKIVQKTDQRVTGSDVIDSSLQEIFGYILRDYITPWYHLVSNDTQFPDKAVKKSGQNLAINVSNRVKEIDWLPYLTTKLVDDAATHLRLFRQARAKMKVGERVKGGGNGSQGGGNGSSRSPRRAAHRRNKSETDAGRHISSTLPQQDTSVVHMNVLEDIFFDLECKMENNLICRDIVCMDVKKEMEFLSELTEILLYLLLPDEDFQCKSVRFIVRELFSSCIMKPLLDLVSDPDYINQVITWLCFRDVSLPSDIFLTTLRLTDNCDELKYTKEIVAKEIQLLRSRDSGGESDTAIKQQLSSLNYVIKVIDNRLAKIQDDEYSGQQNDFSKFLVNFKPSFNLPLDVILKNNVALSYFIDYVTNIGQQSYLFFYLNIEGWKVTAEQQISNIELNRLHGGGSEEDSAGVYERLRESACHIYEQYLSECGGTGDEMLLRRLRGETTETVSELWLEDVRGEVWQKLEEQLSGLERTSSYIRLLAELDLLAPPGVEEDTLSAGSASPDKEHLTQTTQARHSRSASDACVQRLNANPEPAPTPPVAPEPVVTAPEPVKRTGNFTLHVEIIEAGVVSDKGKTYGIYATAVRRTWEVDGEVEEWHVYRRYSDYHELHARIKSRWVDLGRLPFPAKKTFHNMERGVLERRMRMLNAYMDAVCRPKVLDTHVGLRAALLAFLHPTDYDRTSASSSHITHTLRHGIRTIRSVPEQVIQTVDEVVSRVLKGSSGEKGAPEASKVGAALDADTDDNIPLRIMLLLMDEVFDLRSRNQWLRRRIVTLLRQLIRTMFGDIVNRRILDYVSVVTGPANVARYLHTFKQSLWPGGARAERPLPRTHSARCRTRVAAKVAMLSSLSDELKHIIGSETTRRGLLTVFDLFQRPILNRRLLYVFLEGIICTLFPDRNMTELFQKLHSNSRRIRDQKPNSYR